MKFNITIVLSNNIQLFYKNQTIKHWCAGYADSACRVYNECSMLSSAIEACDIQAAKKGTMVFDSTVINMGNILAVTITEAV